MAISTALTRPLQLLTRFMQWSSAVIVMGIVSYLINKGPRGQHLIFQEVIVRPSHSFFFFFPGKNLLTFRQAVLSVAFFLPAFISPFLPKALSKFVLAIDLIFSYLYDLCLHPSNSTYANVLQLVDRVHLRCSGLQLAQLPHPRSPGPRLRDQEGERVLHLPGFVSTCLPTPTERQTC